MRTHEATITTKHNVGKRLQSPTKRPTEVVLVYSVTCEYSFRSTSPSRFEGYAVRILLRNTVLSRSGWLWLPSDRRKRREAKCQHGTRANPLTATPPDGNRAGAVMLVWHGNGVEGSHGQPPADGLGPDSRHGLPLGAHNRRLDYSPGEARGLEIT